MPLAFISLHAAFSGVSFCRSSAARLSVRTAKRLRSAAMDTLEYIKYEYVSRVRRGALLFLCSPPLLASLLISGWPMADALFAEPPLAPHAAHSFAFAAAPPVHVLLTRTNQCSYSTVHNATHATAALRQCLAPAARCPRQCARASSYATRCSRFSRCAAQRAASDRIGADRRGADRRVGTCGSRVALPLSV